jgi:2-methylcitrate dehydratase PrpD
VRDDMHLGSVSHIGAVVLPPLLVLAEQLRPAGSELLAAIVAGYEAGGRLGRAILDVEVARIHRPTGIVGAFAGAAATARLARLQPAPFAAALGLAANTAAGYNEWAATGGSEMFLQAGFIARNGWTAMQLAAAGAQVSPTALEGPAGMLAAFGKTETAALDRALHGRAEILEVFFKEVPACNFAQTAAQAARDLAIDQKLDAAAIESVAVRVPYAAAHYPGCDARGPFAHALQAKMSIQYNVAVALTTRGFAEHNYLPVPGSAIEQLAARIALSADEALTAAYPARQGAEVEVRLSDGSQLTQRSDDVAPAAERLVRERFRTHAGRVLGAAAAAELAACIDGLDHEADAGRLLELCRLPAAARPA